MFDMSDVENDLRSRVESFVTELSDIIRRQALAAVEEVLKKGEGSAAPAKKAGRPAKAEEPKARAKPAAKAAPTPTSKASAAAAKRKAGEKRTPQQLAQITEQVYNYIKSNAGQGVEQIAK